ncbi:MAG: hypothetical protein IJ955_02860 [Oscillospiraceae bacterium]|nr:hypothetical protein [Oscillospiraceae bacterium]
MVKNKVKFSLWLSPEVRKEVEDFCRENRHLSQSEFIENAVSFYLAYLHAQKAEMLLPNAVAEMIDGKLEIMMKKLGRMLFKHAVETNITNHLIAADTDLSQQTYEHLRNRSVREVRETNGEITFLDDLKFQKGW